MATVIIPFPLRKHTNTLREVIVAGTTLGEILDNLLAEYPGLQVINEQPGLLSLFINGRPVSCDKQGKTAVAPDDEITLIIPIAGG